MKGGSQRLTLLLWGIVPICAGLVYPYLFAEPRYVEWLTIVLVIYVLFFSVVIHELAHGLAAYLCGDTTAKQAGRLTLNPLQHVSVVGSILVPLGLYFMQAPAVFGWAKPVPFNPVNLREHPRDQVLLAVAGPLSNFTLAYLCFNLFFVANVFIKQVFPDASTAFPSDIFAPITFHNLPLEALWFVLFEILFFGMIINLILGVFNLIPFPPLDGSWILKALLPKRAIVFFGKLQIAGFVLIILALWFHLLEVFLYPVVIIIMVFQFLINFWLG